MAGQRNLYSYIFQQGEMFFGFSFFVTLLLRFLSFRARYYIGGLRSWRGEYDGSGAQSRSRQKEIKAAKSASLFPATPISSLASPPTSQPFSPSLSTSLSPPRTLEESGSRYTFRFSFCILRSNEGFLYRRKILTTKSIRSHCK